MRNFAKFLFLGLSIIVIASCTNSSSGDPKTSACDVLGLETRILNGTQCSLTNSPVVQLSMLGRDGEIALCSGTLVTGNKILTAAHCFLEIDVVSVSALVEGRDVPVSRVVVHPNASKETLPQNDVAIAELARAVDAPTMPIVLSRTILDDDIISIFGYGLNDDNIAGQLRSGQMRVITITPQFISAKYTDKGSNTCFGDSGGPAVMQITNSAGILLAGVVGITSFGTSAQCAEGDISSFTNVQGSSILNFITAQVPNIGVI